MDANNLLIEAEAERRMKRSLIPNFAGVVCNFQHGILTLYGVVASFEDRYAAQELIQDIEGVEIIDNQLDVSAKRTSPDFDNVAVPDDARWQLAEEPALLKIPYRGPAETVLTPARTG